MKNTLLLMFGLALASCGSDSTTGTATMSATAVAMPAASTNPDPRVAAVRQQHELLLAKQKEYVLQLGQLQGLEKLTPQREKKSKGQFASLIERSQANLTALDQLDPDKAKDPAQVALVGEIAEKQAYLVTLGEKQLAGIHNEHYLNNR